MTNASKHTDWQTLAALRFFLAWVVLCVHLKAFAANPAAWILAFDSFGGKAAVMGFLLVSGYSIAASLERSTTGFYKRRFLRIYPLYIFTLALAAVLQFTAGPSSASRLPDIVNGGHGWSTLVGNVLLLQTFVVKPLAFDGPVWSLAVEASFYVLAPLFLRMRTGVLLALVVFSASCYPLPKHTDWGLVYLVLSKLNALRYLWCWLLGFLIRRNPTPLVLVVGVLGVVPTLLGHDTPEPLCAVTYLLSLGLVAAARKTRLPAAVTRFANYLGDLSYPMYLIHFPVFIFAALYLDLHAAVPLVGLALVATVVAFHLVDEYVKPRYLVPLLARFPG